MKELASKGWNLIEKIVYACLNLLFRMLGKQLSDEQVNAFIQFVKFGIVGVSNTLISYVIYTISLLQFRAIGVLPKSDYFVAQLVAFVLSVLWSFYWNNKMVFTLEEGAHRNIWKALFKTYVSYSFTGLFLNSILIVLWIEICHISEFIAPIINLLVSVPVNFLINKFWAFKSN